MTTKPAPERPDWLVPDAPVVVYSDDPRNPIAVRTTIVSIAKTSFKIAHKHFSDNRFRISDQAYHSPGMWGHSYYVVPVDGVKARTAANGAVLIAALQAVEYED